MDKRYVAAFLVSLLILLAYPHYLQWITPPTSKGVSLEEPRQDLAPALPPPRKAPLLEAATFSYKDGLYELVFSSRGGGIVFFKQGDALFYEGGPEDEAIFGMRILNETEDLSQEIFRSEPSPRTDTPPQFIYEKPGQYRVTRRVFIGRDTPTMALEFELVNLTERERHFPLEFGYALEPRLLHSYDEAQAKMVSFSGSVLHSVGYGAFKKKGFSSAEPLEWHGLLRKYYALLVKPDWKLIGQETRLEGGRLRSNLRFSPVSLGPGEKKTLHLLIYTGPQRYDLLKGFGLGFEKILSQGWLGFLRLGILISLHFFYRLIGNYGVAILLVTLVLKLLFSPLTHLSYRSMGKMQALQPKIKALQKQFQKDPGRLNKEMMELYRRNRVNPMGGCLPLVLQIPIFIAFYQVLSEAVDLKGAGFVGWIHDLSEPDRLFSWSAPLPFVGNAFNLLPILMIGSMLWQQKLTPQTATAPGQQKLMYLMPIIFGFVFYSLPSGLVLYWLVNNLLTIFHQLFIKRIPVILHHEDR